MRVLLCNRFRGDAKPGIVCHVDSFIVEGPNAISLLPVPLNLAIEMSKGILGLTSECHTQLRLCAYNDGIDLSIQKSEIPDLEKVLGPPLRWELCDEQSA